MQYLVCADCEARYLAASPDGACGRCGGRLRQAIRQLA